MLGRNHVIGGVGLHLVAEWVYDPDGMATALVNCLRADCCKVKSFLTMCYIKHINTYQIAYCGAICQLPLPEGRGLQEPKLTRESS
jgi:hypothetical protein